MSYTLNYTKIALEDIEHLKKSGDKAALKKLSILLKELCEHPRIGEGQPEQLKYELAGKWSRKINQKHRILYEIDDIAMVVNLLYARSHYGDK